MYHYITNIIFFLLTADGLLKKERKS